MMGRLLSTKLIIERQNDAKDLYHPTLISGYINFAYPWSCPTAVLDIISTLAGGTSVYVPNFRVDDVVRVQVDIRYNLSEPPVFVDIFEGRILKIEGKWGEIILLL